MSAPASPTLTKRNAIRAVSAATRRSEASAMAAPAPGHRAVERGHDRPGKRAHRADEVAGQPGELQQRRPIRGGAARR